MAPGFWDDAAAARKIQQDRGRLQEAIESWESCHSTWEEASLLLEMAQEEEDEEAAKEVAESLDKLENRKSGDSGFFGPFFNKD